MDVLYDEKSIEALHLPRRAIWNSRIPGTKALWDPSGAKPLLDSEVHFGALGVSSENLSSVSHGSEVLGQAIVMTDMRLEDSRRLQDGSGVEDLVTSGLGSPRGIALDVAGGKMYWTDWGTEKIQRANLDGTPGPSPTPSPTL